MNKFILSLGFSAILFLSGCQQQAEKTTTLLTDSLSVGGQAISKELQLLNDKVLKEPGNPSNFNERAKYYVKKQELSLAYDDLLKGFQLDTTYMPLYNTLADYHLYKSEPAQAKAALEKGLTVNPKSYMTYVKLGELFYLVKKYDLAFEKINEGLKINKYYSDGYFWKGMIYKDKKDLPRAESNFMTAVEQDPDNYKAYMQLGIIAIEQKKSEALDHFTAAIRIRPESGEAYYARGYYYQNASEFDKAIQDYTQVVQLDSMNASAHFNLGIIRYELKVIDLAMLDFTRATKANPKYAEAYYMRGLCEESKGMDAQAIIDFEYAISLKPDYPNAKMAIDRVNKTAKIK